MFFFALSSDRSYYMYHHGYSNWEEFNFPLQCCFLSVKFFSRWEVCIFVRVWVITIGSLMGPMAFPANGSSYLGYSHRHQPRGQPNLLLIGQTSASTADCIYERWGASLWSSHGKNIQQCSRAEVVSGSVGVTCWALVWSLSLSHHHHCPVNTF